MLGMEKLKATGSARGATRLITPALRWLLAVALAAAGISGASAQDSSGGKGPSGAPAEPGPKRRMVSLVVLSNDYVEFTAKSLSEKLDELYPGKFLPERQQANFVVGGPAAGQFLIKSTIPMAAGLFMLISVPAPYTELSGFAHFIADPALRRIAEAQHCWLSIDLVSQSTSDQDAYRFIAVALAKLAPADAAVLVKPDDNSSVPFDDALRQRLAAGQFMP
jgi:hypothetical protein